MLEITIDCRILDPFGHEWLLGHEIEKNSGRCDDGTMLHAELNRLARLSSGR
jgi:hypothetical protein